jgi:hypothetical protein
MFYFGFLSSYLPYLLLIAAPLCYFIYGTVIDPNIVDEDKIISIESDYPELSDNSSIHYNSVEQIIGQDAYKYSPKIFANIYKSIYSSPPPLKNIFTGSDIWSRPPPLLIM